MRVISQYTAPRVQVRPQRQRSLGDGSIEITQEPIYAVFTSLERGAFLYENEEAAALRHFNFHGNTQDIGEAIPTNPIDRISVYDTDAAAKEAGWDEKTQQLVEDHLRHLSMEDPQSFLIVESTPIASPFPAYDDYDGDPVALCVKLVEDGHDLEQVLYYERVFGHQRPEIIEALEQALEVKRELSVQA
jgi:hypothetical protein